MIINVKFYLAMNYKQQLITWFIWSNDFCSDLKVLFIHSVLKFIKELIVICWLFRVEVVNLLQQLNLELFPRILIFKTLCSKVDVYIWETVDEIQENMLLNAWHDAVVCTFYSSCSLNWVQKSNFTKVGTCFQLANYNAIFIFILDRHFTISSCNEIHSKAILSLCNNSLFRVIQFSINITL